jgi:hypothetical protein
VQGASLVTSDISPLRGVGEHALCYDQTDLKGLPDAIDDALGGGRTTDLKAHAARRGRGLTLAQLLLTEGEPAELRVRPSARTTGLVARLTRHRGTAMPCSFQTSG